MNKDKTSPNKIPGDYPLSEAPTTNSSGPSQSEIEMFKKLYLPNSKANNSPSEESIENANGLRSLKNPDSHT